MADVTTPTPANPAQKDWLLILTYVFPIVLIYTMIKKGKEGNILAHCKNAAGAVAIYLVIQIVYRVLGFALDIKLLFTILQLLNLITFLAMLYGAWQASQGKVPNLLVITQIGQKIPLEKWFHDSTSASANTATPAAPTPAPMAAPTAQSAAAPVPAPMPAPVAPAAPVVTPTEPTPPTPPATPAA